MTYQPHTKSLHSHTRETQERRRLIKLFFAKEEFISRNGQFTNFLRNGQTHRVYGAKEKKGEIDNEGMKLTTISLCGFIISFEFQTCSLEWSAKVACDKFEMVSNTILIS